MDNFTEIFKDDPEILQNFEMKKQTSLLSRLLEETSKKSAMEIKAEFIKGDKGDSIVGPEGPMGPVGPEGPMGPSPIAGVDYPIPKNGRDGANGYTPTPTEIISLIKPLIPEPIQGEPGINGKTPTAKEIIKAIQSLEGDEATSFAKRLGSIIDISYIRNAQTFMFNGKRIKIEELMHGSGSSSGGSTLHTETPTGTVDDSNVTFTVAHEPFYISVNGAIYSVGTGLYSTYVAGTITLTSAVGTGGFITSYYQS